MFTASSLLLCTYVRMYVCDSLLLLASGGCITLCKKILCECCFTFYPLLSSFSLHLSLSLSPSSPPLWDSLLCTCSLSVPFAGDNFVRFTGDVKNFSQQQSTYVSCSVCSHTTHAVMNTLSTSSLLPYSSTCPFALSLPWHHTSGSSLSLSCLRGLTRVASLVVVSCRVQCLRGRHMSMALISTPMSTPPNLS